MSPLILDGAQTLGLDRGEIAVAVPVYNAHDSFVECMRSVLARTPREVPLLIMDDASPDERSRKLLVELDHQGVLEHRVHYVRSAENRGFVRTVNDAFTRCAPADVIVLNSDCVVTNGWFEAMRRAAGEPLVATVSVFTNHGTIVSLPDRNMPAPELPQTIGLDEAAQRIQANSPRVRPRLPAVIGHCFLVKRSALELVGPLDEEFSPGYGEEVDFAQRCLRYGLCHVLADDAFVQHTGSASFEKENPIKAAHDQMIEVRYRYYGEWVHRFSSGRDTPFARTFGRARRAMTGDLSVTIDARCLGPIATGTQIHTLELIRALSREQRVWLRAVVPSDIGDYARDALTDLSGVEITNAGVGRTDIVHRPLQVSSRADLEFMSGAGDKTVITHQDLIGYHNPTYFQSFREWEDYRNLNREALASADRVVFVSHHAAREALAEELVDPERIDVTYNGTDHSLARQPQDLRPPAGLSRLAGSPFLLCLGTDFAHKNRVFALRILEALRRNHDFDGGLVLAGPHVATGSSAPEEAEFLVKHPELERWVLDVAAVSEEEKHWLLREARLMLHPSVYEGFGLVPFESADAGLACAFAWHTSLADLLPRKLALIEPWDAEATAARLVAYIGSPELRAEHVAAVRAAGARFTWRSVAHRLIDVYERAASDPRKPRSTLTFESQNGLVVPPDIQRPLLAISSRPLLARMTFGTLRTFYRLSYRARHRGRAPAT